MDNEMFWTKFTRIVCKISLWLGIIASIIVGIAFADSTDGISLFLLIIGPIVSFLSVSLVMMICEISENLYELKNKVKSISSQTKPMTQSYSNGSASNKSWVCKCGARNSSATKFCKSCGRTKSED